MDWIVLGYLLVINYLASIIQGVTTFGDAIVLHILWDAMTSLTGSLLHTSPLGAVDIEIITVLMYSRSIVLTSLNAYLSIRSNGMMVSWWLLLVAAVPQVISSAVGEKLLVALPKDALRKWFGVSLLAFACCYVGVKWWKQRIRLASKGADEDPNRFAASLTAQAGCVVTALIGGIAGALTGVGGPPWMIFILLFNVPSVFVRVLFPTAAIPSATIRFGLAIYLNLLQWDMFWYHFVAVAAGVAGLMTGYLLGRRIGPETFNVVVLVLLILASLVMLNNESIITCAALSLGVVAIGVSWVREAQLLSAAVPTGTPSKQKEEEASVEDVRHFSVDEELTDFTELY